MISEIVPFSKSEIQNRLGLGINRRPATAPHQTKISTLPVAYSPTRVRKNLSKLVLNPPLKRPAMPPKTKPGMILSARGGKPDIGHSRRQSAKTNQKPRHTYNNPIYSTLI